MFTIEPCCTQKHWPAIRSKIKAGGTMMFQGYGDLSLNELLPVMMTRYSEADMIIVCPALKDAAASLLLQWMEKGWPDKKGGHQYVIGHLTLVTDLGKKKSPAASAWVKGNPYPGRLTVCNVQQNDTCILLPDIAVHGAVNLVHGGHFTAIATTSPKLIASLRGVYDSLCSQVKSENPNP